ncbi:hypothetical protein TRABTM_A_00990 [secondary endosymbiont of Trabutina mannipara]|uniref:Uncharacterized protein n=1 Tax=secondary endosymbiont of Trabutina mannipara TaxID=1835721 RepID=A0A1C3L3V9_9ENTR|nr:hypothetical protein TRABTM_A_00990 [secondary endosymbiont of Trabutina mannipara]
MAIINYNFKYLYLIFAFVKLNKFIYIILNFKKNVYVNVILKLSGAACCTGKLRKLNLF